jgi:hypothetical protein
MVRGHVFASDVLLHVGNTLEGEAETMRVMVRVGSVERAQKEFLCCLSDTRSRTIVVWRDVDIGIGEGIGAATN